MDFIEKFLLGGAGSLLLGLLLERARRYWKRADNRQDEAEERERKSEQFDAMFALMKRARRKATVCRDMHAGNDPALGYALNDLVGELDLSEWEARPATEAE